MASQKDVKNRIASIKNINKITRAMEMVAAARLRRSEQRIDRYALVPLTQLRGALGAVLHQDNRRALHYPVNDYYGYRRVMHRITIEGERTL